VCVSGLITKMYSLSRKGSSAYCCMAGMPLAHAFCACDGALRPGFASRLFLC
jgi:hypothetical protein